MTTDVDHLAKSIAAELEAYNNDVADAVKDAVKDAADVCAKSLRDNSPKLTGIYSRGWRKKTVYEDGADIRITVYNANKPQLTHLLEFGHASRTGGRTQPNPHIKKSEDAAAERLGKTVKIKIGGA